MVYWLRNAFPAAADLDAVGVFGYSDEEGTAAARLDGHLDPTEIDGRRAQIADLAEELVSQRAEARIGESVVVLVEEVGDEVIGRAAHQGPEVDGCVRPVPRQAVDGRVEREGELVGHRSSPMVRRVPG